VNTPRWLRTQRQIHRVLALPGAIGICANQPPVVPTGLEPMFCTLLAGHTGAHSDGEGHWMSAERCDLAFGDGYTCDLPKGHA